MRAGRIFIDEEWKGRRLREAFRWRVDGWSWGEASPSAREIDGTLRLTVESEAHPGSAVAMYVPTHLRRDESGEPWRCKLTDEQARELSLGSFYDGWDPGAANGTLGVSATNVYWYDTVAWSEPNPDGVLEQTAAPRDTGAAKREIAEAFDLPPEGEIMQGNWAMEVSGTLVLDDLVAFYAGATSDEQRFDAMAIALFCYDERLRNGGGASPELEELLRRDFPLHGNTVEYWGCFAVLTPEGDLDLEPDRERVFAVTPAVRRAWASEARRIDLA